MYPCTVFNTFWVTSMNQEPIAGGLINENLFFSFFCPSRRLYAQNVCVCVCVGPHVCVFVWATLDTACVFETKALDGALIPFPTFSVRRRKEGEQEDRLVAQ